MNRSDNLCIEKYLFYVVVVVVELVLHVHGQQLRSCRDGHCYPIHTVPGQASPRQVTST